MIARFLVAAVTCISLGQSASATPQEDFRYITEHVVSGENVERWRASFATAFTEISSDSLLSKSVKILKPKQFAEMLPEAIFENYFNAVRTNMQSDCFQRFSAKQIGVFANILRKGSNEGTSASNTQGSSPVKRNRLGNASESENAGLVGFAVTFCAHQKFEQVRDEIKANPKVYAINDVRFLADILDTPGIAHFPNRIVRKNILQDIRKHGLWN